MSKLLQSSLQPSSLPTYQRAWRLFSQFFHRVYPCVELKLPFAPPTLALFIAYLYDHKYASSTVSTYVSALGYFHKLHGHDDPSKNFVVMQMMKGYSKLDLPILHRKAMCVFAFHAFARIGELTSSSANHNLHFRPLVGNTDTNHRVVSLTVTFYDFKHSYNQRPFSLNILPSPYHCPVQLIVEGQFPWSVV